MKKNGTAIKGISIIVIASFLYSNCVYAIPACSSLRKETLSPTSAFQWQDFQRELHGLNNDILAGRLSVSEIKRIIREKLTQILRDIGIPEDKISKAGSLKKLQALVPPSLAETNPALNSYIKGLLGIASRTKRKKKLETLLKPVYAGNPKWNKLATTNLMLSPDNISADKGGQLYLTGQFIRGIIQIPPNSIQFSVVREPSNLATYDCSIADNYVFTATASGIFIYDKNTGLPALNIGNSGIIAEGQAFNSITARKTETGYEVFAGTNRGILYRINIDIQSGRVKTRKKYSAGPLYMSQTKDGKLLCVYEPTVVWNDGIVKKDDNYSIKILNAVTLKEEYCWEIDKSKAELGKAVEDNNGFIYVINRTTKSIDIFRRGRAKTKRLEKIGRLSAPGNNEITGLCISGNKLIAACSNESELTHTIWAVSLSAKAVIPDMRRAFDVSGAEYQPEQPKAKIYENLISPFIEEYGLWFASPILRLLGIKINKNAAEMPILPRLGFSTIPIICGSFFILINYFISVVNLPITIAIACLEGILLLVLGNIMHHYLLEMHKTTNSKFGATIVTIIKLFTFYAVPFVPQNISIPLLIFSPFIIHSAYNTYGAHILAKLFGEKADEFKAICHTMYYRDELTERIREEWEKRNRAPTQEEINNAQKEVEEKTKELEDTLSEAEKAIIEEIANDGEFATELDDEARHNLREKVIKSAGKYIRNGGGSFEDWINGLHTDLKDVFLEDSPEKIAKLLQNERVRQSLKKTYDMADRDFLHHPPTPSGLSPLVSSALHSLQHLLGLGHGHDHHHPPKGTTFRSIIFFIIGIGALIYYILTNDDSGILFAVAIGSVPPGQSDVASAIGAVIQGQGGANPPELEPKPETLEKVTIDLKEYVKERKIRDYYFSSEAAGLLDAAAGRSGSLESSGISKNNILLTGPNTELLEYIMESTVSKIASGENPEEYPDLRNCDFLLFNAAWIVDAVAIPGTIEDIMDKLKKEIEGYYKDKKVVLFINFQDLYDLGQMEGRRTDAIAGIYMRLAGLLESRNVSVVGLASDFLAKRLSGETRMMQYFEVLPAERTEDYRIGQIIRDELAWINDAYKAILGENKIKMKAEEVRRLADRLAKFSKSQEPPQILKNRLEKWFTEKFLKIEKLRWEERYHAEEIEKLILEYRRTEARTELFEKYMRKWLEYHTEEISRIKKETAEYKEWFGGLSGSYWLTVDEILPKEEVWEQKVPGMKDALNGGVIDQQPAISSICASFEQAQIMHDKDHPIGVFIFVGPTGVGKTEVARALNRYLSGSENELVRIDGSEHGQAADLYKLIGPPPAIIGHEQGGTLTNAVAKRDFCIVLFDELEKSHATIQDIFLQIIDGARLTDGRGKTVNFRNTVIIMTSNLGYTARAKSGLPPEIEQLKKIAEEEIQKKPDEDITNMLKRILEGYTHLNETIPVFQDEIENIQRLLEGEEAEPPDNVISLAAFKQRKGNIDQKKKLRRDYMIDFINYYIDVDLGETFFDISALQYYYACLNYYQDTKPLTKEDKSALEELLKKIQKIYELDQRRLILMAVSEGKTPDESVLAQLKELLDIKAQTPEEQKRYYLDKMYKYIQDNLTKAVRNAFRQEFLNKLGERNIITFSPLTKGALRLILKLKLKEISKALAKDGFGELRLSDELEELVIKEGFRPDMGARPLIRALRRIILEPLSDVMLKKELLPDRVITAYTDNGAVKFRQEQVEKEPFQNGVSVRNLLTGLKDGSVKDIKEAFKILGIEIPLSDTPGKAADTKGEEQIDFRIQLPSPEEVDILSVDNKKLQEIEDELKEQIADVENKVKQLESQLRRTTENSQRQILQTEIRQINEELEFANGQLRLINLRKQQKTDDAKELQKELNKNKQTETSKREQEINDAFENISITAQENGLEEKPADPSIVYRILEILKSRHRNDAFIVEPSFLVQRNVVDEMARRAYIEKDPVLVKTRFLRLKLAKLSGSLGIIGAFEGAMRGILGAIHEDNLKKGIKTIVIIDIAEIQKEIERIRFNPFLLSFFLRLFHKDTDISFIMTSSDNSAVSEDVFERYFKDLQIKPQDLDNILEALVTCSENWLAEKGEKTEKAPAPQIPFDIKQRALKIWRQFYSGEPPLETIKEWFKGVNDRRAQGPQEISRDRENLLKKTANRIKTISDEMAEEEAKEWTIEGLMADRELLNLLAQFSNLDRKEEAILRAKGAITKEELDREILRQERAKTDLKQGEEIDISSININPEERALNLESNLNLKIFGQEAAIKRVSTAVKINTAGLRMRNQPVGSFLYGGPTGVGKTETAKQTAKAMGMRFFRIDMSEFKSREDVWKLIGAPRGYIGWDEGEGTFIDWMRKYPRTVILFDEVEKGHPDIFNLLLQILEDGIVTSNRGKTVDFSESIIFMTTNLGVKEEVILENGRRETVFDMYPEMEEVYKSGDSARIDDFNKRMSDRINNRINMFFRPELLNRLDAIEVFLPFTKDKILPIAKKMLKTRFEQLEEEYGIKIIYDEETLNQAAEALKEAGFSPKSGAREIERLSREWITQGFRPILKSVKDAPRDTHVKFAWQDNKISFQIEQSEEAKKLPRDTAERIGLLFTWLRQSKGEGLKPQFIKELFYPMEAKQKTTGAKAPFTDKAIIREVTGANPIKRDTSVDEIAAEITNKTGTGSEGTEVPVLISDIFDWLKETTGLAKRINLWRYIWEKGKRSIPNFWELDRTDIKRLYDEFQENDKLGNKKIEVMQETKEGILIGIRANSTLGRELERLLLEEEYQTEEEIRQKLHKHKNLQGFAIAALKLKQAGINPVRNRPAEGTATTAMGRSVSNGVNAHIELGKDSTIFWVKIPARQKTADSHKPLEKIELNTPALADAIQLQAVVKTLQIMASPTPAQAPASPSAEPKGYQLTVQEIQIPEGYSILDCTRIGNVTLYKVQNSQNKYNYIRSDGTPISSTWFINVRDPVSINNQPYFGAQDDNGRWNIIKPDGTPISTNWFEDVRDPVSINNQPYFGAQNDTGKWNIIKPDGKPISTDWFKDVRDPVSINNQPYFRAQNDRGKWNMIKPDGTPISTEWFNAGNPVSINNQPYFKAQNDTGKWNIIKPDGTPISTDWFKDVRDPVSINNQPYFRAQNDNMGKYKYNIIKPDGKPISSTWFKNVGNPVSINNQPYFRAENNRGKYNIIKPDGKPISDTWFEAVGNPVSINNQPYFRAQNDRGKWNIIKPDGKPISTDWFKDVRDPVSINNQPYFRAQNDNTGKYNIIKPDGKPISTDWFKDIRDPVSINNQPYFGAQNDEGRWNIIKPDGKELLDNWVDRIFELSAEDNYLTFSYISNNKLFEARLETKPVTKLLAEAGTAKEAPDSQTLAEIKDIAGRLAKIFNGMPPITDEMEERVVYFDAMYGDETIEKLVVGLRIDLQAVRELCVKESIPFNTVLEILNTIFPGLNADGIVRNRDTELPIRDLQKVKTYLLELLTSSGRIPAATEIPDNIKPALYRLLTLNPDGTPAERERITQNVDNIFTINPSLLQIAAPAESGFTINIFPMNAEPKYLATAAARDPLNPLFGFSIQPVTDFWQVVFCKDGERETVYDIPARYKSSVVNIGVSAGEPKRYVFVIKDEVYSGIIKNKDFTRCTKAESDNLSFEIISESECNYRLTIGEPGFAELFSWDLENIETAEAKAPPVPTPAPAPAPAQAGKSAAETVIDAIIAVYRRYADKGVQIDEGAIEKIVRDICEKIEAIAAEAGTTATTPALTDTKIQSAGLLTDEVLQALWISLTSDDNTAYQEAVKTLQKPENQADTQKIQELCKTIGIPETAQKILAQEIQGKPESIPFISRIIEGIITTQAVNELLEPSSAKSAGGQAGEPKPNPYPFLWQWVSYGLINGQADLDIRTEDISGVLGFLERMDTDGLGKAGLSRYYITKYLGKIKNGKEADEGLIRLAFEAAKAVTDAEFRSRAYSYLITALAQAGKTELLDTLTEGNKNITALAFEAAKAVTDAEFRGRAYSYLITALAQAGKIALLDTNEFKKDNKNIYQLAFEAVKAATNAGSRSRAYSYLITALAQAGKIALLDTNKFKEDNKNIYQLAFEAAKAETDAESRSRAYSYLITALAQAGKIALLDTNKFKEDNKNIYQLAFEAVKAETNAEFRSRTYSYLINTLAGIVYYWDNSPPSTGTPAGRLISTVSELFVLITDRKIPPAKYIKAEAKNTLLTTAISPDSRYIAAGGVDKIARLYNSVTGELIAETGDLGNQIRCLGFSPDGRFLAVGTDDGRVRLIEIVKKSDDKIKQAFINTRVFTMTSDLASGVICCSFSPDGRFLAVGTSDFRIRLIEIGGKSDSEIRQAFTDANDINKVFCITNALFTNIMSLSFSPDGRFLAVGTSDRRIRLIETGGKSDSEIRQAFTDAKDADKVFAITDDLGANALSLGFSPDGRFLAAGTGNRRVRLIEIGGKSNDEIKQAFRDANEPDKVFAETGDLGDLVTCLGFSPDGRFLAIGIDVNSNVRLIETGGKSNDEIKQAFRDANEPDKVFAIISDLGGRVRSLGFSPDGTVFCFTAGNKLHIYRGDTAIEPAPPEEKEIRDIISQAYFSEMTDDEIDPQIRWILEKHPERFRFIKGKTTEGTEGTLVISGEQKKVIEEALTDVQKSSPSLYQYGVVVVKGAGFSGHNSARRGGRIYIPLELLEVVQEIKNHPDFIGTKIKIKEKELNLWEIILMDSIEHEYLHSIGRTEEEILANSKTKRPWVYEKARVLYRKYIAEKLVKSAEGITGEKTEELKIKLNRILMRVQANKKIGLTETQLHRLLWLIDRSKEVNPIRGRPATSRQVGTASNGVNLAPEIAELVNLILEPNYTGNPGLVVMALEKEILEAADSGKSIVDSKIQKEKAKLFNVHRTHTGDLRFEGPEVQDNVKETIKFMDRFPVPEPARAEEACYVLISEFRTEEFKETIKKISDTWNVHFVTSIPEGINPLDVVVLVDPEDISEYTGYNLYLPLIYSRQSLALAAWMSINKHKELKDTPVLSFVKGFYETLLNATLTEEEVIEWFTRPDRIKDRIKYTSEELRYIRIASIQLDASA